MRRDALLELHYITPICNVPSIVQNGVLSHARAAQLAHGSVAMSEIQSQRARVQVPGGRRLHDYANLYICGRNPMLYKRLDQREEICVLSISPDILDSHGVIVTDSNASSDYVRFAAAPLGLEIVDEGLTFADYWTDGDPIQQWRKKAAKCAEILVPDRVDPRFVCGGYVCCDESKAHLESLNVRLTVTVNRHLFFL